VNAWCPVEAVDALRLERGNLVRSVERRRDGRLGRERGGRLDPDPSAHGTSEQKRKE
jgi:hypothetical protein